MKTVNIHEAKTHLSKLVQEVAAGEEIIIANAGRPVARLVPVTGPGAARSLGFMRGKLAIARDFDVPLPDDLQAEFER